MACAVPRGMSGVDVTVPDETTTLTASDAGSGIPADGPGKTPERTPTLYIAAIARRIRGNFDRQVAKYKVTRSQWSLVATVSHIPGATQRTIADALDITEASAGRLIDRLCADGLLERRDKKDDRRARAVYLSPTAQPMLDILAQFASESEERLLKGFSEEERELLQSYLIRVYNNVNRG